MSEVDFSRYPDITTGLEQLSEAGLHDVALKIVRGMVEMRTDEYHRGFEEHKRRTKAGLIPLDEFAAGFNAGLAVAAGDYTETPIEEVEDQQ